MAFVWFPIVSLLSIKAPKFLALVTVFGREPNSSGHQGEAHADERLSNNITSFFWELSFKQCLFIHKLIACIQSWKRNKVDGSLLKANTTIGVSSA